MLEKKFDLLTEKLKIEILPFLGKESDSEIETRFNVGRHTIGRFRRKLNISSISDGHPKITLECENCKMSFKRTYSKALSQSKKFCPVECHDTSQRKRDYDRLRYGKGWLEVRKSIRERDKICQVCGKTPEEQGSALPVHHKVPFRFGGANTSDNLITLCSSCHRKIEFLTEKALSKIQIDITLVNGTLEIFLQGKLKSSKDIR